MANNNPFYRFWSRPNRSQHTLLADAHDWFQHYFPGSNPQLVQEEQVNTLQTRLQMPFSLALPGGEVRSVGAFVFLAQVHVRDGFIGLRFSEFEHIGNRSVPGVGPLSRPHPGDHPVLDQAQWTSLKQQFANHIKSYLDSFIA